MHEYHKKDRKHGKAKGKANISHNRIRHNGYKRYCCRQCESRYHTIKRLPPPIKLGERGLVPVCRELNTEGENCIQ